MSQYAFVRNDINDTYGILKLQDKILEIMVYVDEFCHEHGIMYYLMGGSALGAMRHNGFIPWDDDLDIFMDFENYKRFIRCCEEKLDTDRFYFQKEDSNELPYFFSKIRMNGTTCISEILDKPDSHQGIFIDVMCLNNAAKTKLGKKIQFYAAGMLKAKACSKTKYKANSKKKKVQLWISKTVVVGPIKKFLLHLVRRYNKKDSAQFAHLFGRAKFRNSFYPKRIFESQKFVPFEQVSLAVPAGVDEYLSIRYGVDYMEMPSEETKALYQTHAGIWDVDKDYSEYMK